MKFKLSLLALAMCFCSFAQNSGIKPGDQALFKACLNEEDPYFCTNETFTNIITSLITPKITEEIKNSALKDGLDVSILFISDEEGKVIKEDIQIFCENSNLQASIRSIISRLPAFHPKSEKLTIRKSVHIYNFTFIPTVGYESYIPAPPSMTTKHIGYDNSATYEKCKGDIKGSQICFADTVRQIILKNLQIPDSNVSYSNRFNIYFLVNTDGNIILIDAIGETGEHQDVTEKIKANIKKVFSKIPPAQPALIKNIPVIQDFNVPLSINIKI